MSCAYCGNEKTTKNPQLEIEKKEKLQRMDDLKNGKGGVNNPVEGDPRFPEKPAWVIRDEKRMEETKKMIYNGKEVKVPKPYYID